MRINQVNIKEIILLIFLTFVIFFYEKIMIINLDNYYAYVSVVLFVLFGYFYSYKKILITLLFGSFLLLLSNAIVDIYFQDYFYAYNNLINIKNGFFILIYNIFIYFYFIKTERKYTKVDIEHIHNLGNNGRDFEDYIAFFFRQQKLKAFTTMELKDNNNLPISVMKNSGNGEQGVDVVVFFNKPKKIGSTKYDGYLIQCKHYSSNIGNTAVQEIYSAIPMYSDHFKKVFKPVVMTNRSYSRHARSLAETNGVILIEGEDLLSMNSDNLSKLDFVKKN